MMAVVMNNDTDELYHRLRGEYESAGQSHVFAFWHKLTAEQQQILLNDAQHVQLQTIAPLYHTVIEQERANIATSTPAAQESNITPFNNVTVCTGHSQSGRWYSDGLDAIRAGTVAAVLMAGGAGTRLGSSEPKGCFDIGMPSHSSLFKLQANRIQRLRTLASDSAGNNSGTSSSISVPWYIMTSIITHNATINYFAENNYFDLPQSDIFFFQQRELPALTLDDNGEHNGGRIMMESAYKISLSPNGNGGIFDALKTSGAVADMCRRNIQHVHVYGVDNALVKVADPTLIGYAISVKAQCVNKVVLKTDPAERVGVMCLRNGKPSVVEYSEISKAMSEQRHPITDNKFAGQLVYSAGNIVQHYFTLSTIQSVTEAAAANALSYHIARKVIPYIDMSASSTEKNLPTPITPSQPNGMKLEMFIFDVFERIPVNAMFALAVERSAEFTPVKNAKGTDSPATARRDMTRYHHQLITAAGGHVKVSDHHYHDDDMSDQQLIEISPLISYQGENLATHVQSKTFTPPILLS